jgi:hypothetical protein
MGAASENITDGGSSLLTSAAAVASTPSSELTSDPPTLLTLPIEIIPLITRHLNPRSFGTLSRTCRQMNVSLADDWVVCSQLHSWGLLITQDGFNVTEDGTVILSASPTLSDLWSTHDHINILKQRKQIALELRRIAYLEGDIQQKELILRQAVLLGSVEAVGLWKEFLFKLTNAKEILDHLVSVFLKGEHWVPKAQVDDLIFQATCARDDVIHELLETARGTLYLKNLCCAGSFQAITLIKDKLRTGESRFIKDLQLAEKLVGFVSQGTLESTWTMVKTKKYRRYEKLTLQDVLPEIMSAIDARN